MLVIISCHHTDSVIFCPLIFLVAVPETEVFVYILPLGSYFKKKRKDLTALGFSLFFLQFHNESLDVDF